MAVDLKKLKEHHKDLDNAPLSPVEIGYVADIENYIDDEIIKSYNSDNRNVSIDLSIVNFRYNPVKKTNFTGLTNKRREFLKEHLLEHYRETGWKFDTDLDDGRSMVGNDYFIFKG